MTEVETTNKLPTVSVIIPMKNEEAYIGQCLESILQQDYPKELVEILVVDGGSTDGSVGAVKKLANGHSNIRLLGGRGVNCPAAMNIGIKNSTGNVISKVDAHGYVAADHISTGIKHLSDDKTKCVGGPIEPIAKSNVARANALARSSVFGVGRGVYSWGEKPGFVDTVQCGVYKSDVLEEVGYFDETMQFGEDEEINWRIRKKGYRIFSTPDIKFFYYVRDSFWKLFKQYYSYGLTRVKVIQKHPDFIRVKHLVPAVFVLALTGSFVLAFLSDFFLKVFAGIALIYLVASLSLSALISSKEGWQFMRLLPISFAALHFGYGLGFNRGVIGLCLRKLFRKKK